MEEAEKIQKVLIVEDDSALLSAMVDELTEDGYTVSKAVNGEEGYHTAIEQKPELIIIDILMPKMDGMTMLKKLREDEPYGKMVKVIILTNLNADDKMVADVVETQPTYYLIKSDTNINGLSEKVQEVLTD